MPALESQGRLQHAVLWMANGAGNYGSTVAAPVPINVHMDRTDSEVLDSEGNRIAISATATVDREIVPGSILWEGELSELPAVPTGLLRVVTYNEVPDIKNRNRYRTVTLARHSDSLPTVA